MNKINIILLILVLASAFAVVTVQDRSRQFFIALDKAQKGESLLNEDFSRLKLAQAKLSNHQLIQDASARQNLHSPSLAETQMLAAPRLVKQ